MIIEEITRYLSDVTDLAKRVSRVDAARKISNIQEELPPPAGISETPLPTVTPEANRELGNRGSR